METRKLGYTDLNLTTIGLGTWAIGGGGWRYGWGPQDDTESMAAIQRALDDGVNWIDTAAVYGLGHSEEVVGKAIQGRRHQVCVATKCGRRWGKSPQDIFGRLKAESIRQEAEDSLRRLNIDAIDLYQMHWPDPEGDIEEGWTAMEGLVRAGKVRHIGVSNFSVAQLERILPIHPVASLQPPYSLLRREIEHELLPYCAAHDIGVVVYSPMQAGLLAGRFTRERAAALPRDDWRSTSPSFREPELSANLSLVERLKDIAQRNGRTVAQLAIAWVLRRPEVTAAIVGARRPAQIAETLAAGGWELSPQDVQEIEGLLDERAKALGAP